MVKKQRIIMALSIISFLSLSLVIFSNIAIVTATDFTPIPDPPNQDFSWNFTKGDIIAYKTEEYINGTKIQPGYLNIYNITDFLYDKLGNNSYYFVQLEKLFYNANKSKIEENPMTSTYNFSCINFTNGEMYLHSSQIAWGSGGMGVNYFIPHNGSNLALEWAAYALNRTNYYYYYHNTTIEINTETNEIKFSNNTVDDYILLRYYDNGTLEYAEIFYPNVYYLYLPHKVNYTLKIMRSFDFNPIDDIEWSVDIGDTFIYDIGGEIEKYQIVDLMERTYFHSQHFGYFSQSELRADAWILNASSEWELLYENRTIGAANEYSPIPRINYENVLIFSTDNKTKENLLLMANYQALYYPEMKVIQKGDSVKIVNQSSGDYFMLEISENGAITYSSSERFSVPMWSENLTLIATNPDHFDASIVDGDDSVQIDDIGKDNGFDVDIDISVSDTSQMTCSASIENPTNLGLDKTLLFLDISLNDTKNLENLTITIQYDNETYENVEIWWFNQSADDGFGKWEEIEYTDLSGGTILFTIDHLSVFAVTEAEAEQVPDEDGDEDEDSDGELPPGIPFGNYYLIYFALALMIGVIYITRKKINL